MGRAGQQLLGFCLAFGALVVAAGVFLPRLLGVAAGPEAEVTSIIKRSESRVLELPVPWASQSPGVLRATRRHYDRITVLVAPDRLHAVASSTLDFEGLLDLGAEETRISSLGFEEAPFSMKAGDWLPDNGLAPRLSAVVAALEARRQAVEKADRGALDRLRDSSAPLPEDGAALERVWGVGARHYRVVAWYIRGERGEVQVTERYRLTGGLPDAPVDEQGMRQLRLKPRGRDFFFVSALM